MVSEKGSLKDTPAVKLLLTVFEQRLTGILYIKRKDILKVLYFSRGKLIWAISNSDVDKLENILAAKDLVPMETINKVKKQGRVSDSIGKLLVEKGLITLEELIESSKIQLKRIINSVFKWKDGGFQFVKDAPPERLLSLDLDITQFVVDYIVEEVDVSDIWKEIGSLQVEFIKNPDEQIVKKYRLSDKQKELLNSFDGETKLEAILSRHSTGHRESLLKVIYFYLMAELLLKKEFDLSDLSTFDVEKSIDDLETTAGKDKTVKPAEDSISMESLEPIEPIEPIESMEPIEYMEPVDRGKPKPEESTTGQDDSYDITHESEKSAEETFKDDLEELDSPPPGYDEQAIAPITPLNEIREEKKRLKLFNIIMILIFLILVIGGIILLILPMMESTDPAKNVVEKADKTTTKDIKKIEEKIPAVKEDTTGPGELPDKTETSEQTGEQTGEPGGKTGEKKPGITGTEQTPPTTSPTPGKTAKAYFLEGSFITAGDVWKRELNKARVKYGILLEMDCLKESVMSAYDRISAKKDFYILNRSVGSKTCFLVMWGKFFTHEQATEAIKSTSIPNYFWQQKDPPEIVELSKYL
jgi:hypothetical protein